MKANVFQRLVGTKVERRKKRRKETKRRWLRWKFSENVHLLERNTILKYYFQLFIFAWVVPFIAREINIIVIQHFRFNEICRKRWKLITVNKCD